MRGSEMRKIVYLLCGLCLLLLSAGRTEAVDYGNTTTRQALMGGLADGVSGQQRSSAAASNANRGDSRSNRATGAQPSDMPQPNTPGSITRQQVREQGAENSPVRRAATARVRPAPLSAPPAWAQTPYPPEAIEALEPFGASLFMGNFAGTWHDGMQPQYAVMPGDRIMVQAWGAYEFEGVLVVDRQGNIFIPEVGPVYVEGVSNAALQKTVADSISAVFTQNVEVYASLLSSQPVAVFVTGNVLRPGRYAGGPGDSILYYLDRAGGIIAERGSYRHITVKRNNRRIADIDLYDFLVNGNLPGLRLEDGDVILVGKRGAGVAAMGLIRQQARYEFDGKGISGRALLGMAHPMPGASHASVSGTRHGAPWNAYMTLEEFSSLTLRDEDIVEFHADVPGGTIMVGAAGAIAGASRFAVRKGTTLRALLHYVGVDPALASIKAIYLRRRSVAEQQRKAIQDGLRRLEHTALTATSQSVDEANIRVREAELVQDFVKRAATVEPDGVVVVSRRGELKDVILEDGDLVYVPQKSDVVQVVGEVAIPKAVVYDRKLGVKDYVAGAGGFNDRADRSNVLVMKPNGEIGLVSSLGIGPGDQLMVMPAYDSKAVQSIKDIVQIIYQMAVSAGVVLVPFWR